MDDMLIRDSIADFHRGLEQLARYTAADAERARLRLEARLSEAERKAAEVKRG